MTGNAAVSLVAMVMVGLWFVGQSVVFWGLWNATVAPYFGLDQLAYFEGLLLLVVCRLMFRPPKLSIKFE